MVRYKTEGTLGSYVDVIALPDMPRARQGVGSIHHIAFRAQDDAEREQFRVRLVELGLAPTGLVDRTFFHSTYVWTPAGILIEIATDAPGFTVNEPAQTLGESLVLPEQYEHLRTHIEAHLPAITLPRHRQ
jgi:glyoxalase family protein